MRFRAIVSRMKVISGYIMHHRARALKLKGKGSVYYAAGDPDRIRTGDLHRDRVAC